MALMVALTLSGCSGGAKLDEGPTQAEYAAAVNAARKCVQDRGFVVSEAVEVGTHGELQWGVETAPGSDEARDECTAKHLDDIEGAFLKPHRLTGAERDAAMDDLVACLADAGVDDLSASTTDSRIFVKRIMDGTLAESDLSKALACMERYRGVWPPGDANNP